MARRDALPFTFRIAEALQRGARKGSGLTRVDREALGALGEALRDAPILRLAGLLSRLWPTADRKSALNRFHQLKRRFNTAGVGVILCSPSDNSDPEEKEVWIEADRTPLEHVVAQVSAFPEPEKSSYSLDLFYPGLIGRMPATLLTFPAEVGEFAEAELAAEWREFSEDARRFLRFLSSRFMPMVQILPQGCVACVRGFELLASGGRGEVYGELMRQAKALGVSLEILDAVLLLVQTLTVQELRRRTRYQSRYSGVYFSLNLSPPLLANNFRLARAVIRRFDEEERSLLRFEMTEKFRLPEVRALALLLGEFKDLKFAVDDVNDHHLLTVARLGKYASFTKLSHRYVLDVLSRFPEDPDAGLEALMKHALPGKPHVLEGVEDFELVNAIFEEGLRCGKIEEGSEIYAQGFGCVIDSEWKAFLQVPPGYGWLGQYALPVRDVSGRTADEPPTGRGDTRRDFLGAIEDALRAGGRQVVERLESGDANGLVKLTLDGGRVVYAAPGSTRSSVWKSAPGAEIVVPQGAAIAVAPAPKSRAKKHPSRRVAGIAPKIVELTDFLSRELALADGPALDDERLVARGLWRFAPERYYELRGTLERLSSGPIVETLMGWADEPAVPLAYLLGGYGAGKTFAARMLCLQARQKMARTGRGRAPLYIDLKEIPETVARTGNLEDVLRAGAARIELNEDSWRHLAQAIRAGQVLLVLDGFDEKVGHLADKGAGHRFRRVLHSAAGPFSKVLIVTRQTVFADAASLLREARVEELAATSREQGADARIVEVLPLCPGDRAAFLGRLLPAAEVARVEALIQGVHGLEDLASRPVLLKMIADRRQEFGHILERRGKLACGSVFESIVAEWLARDEEKSVLVPELKLAVMESLAVEMRKTRASGLPALSVQRIVIAEVNGFYGGAPASDPARAGVADVRIAGFLTHDDSGTCRFAHAAFEEFFLARRLASSTRAGEPRDESGAPLSPGARRFLESLT